MNAKQQHANTAAARRAEYIYRLVAAAPPLSVTQRDRLAVLLCPAGAAHEAVPSR